VDLFFTCKGKPCDVHSLLKENIHSFTFSFDIMGQDKTQNKTKQATLLVYNMLVFTRSPVLLHLFSHATFSVRTSSVQSPNHGAEAD
jgi:hypothetical protein